MKDDGWWWWRITLLFIVLLILALIILYPKIQSNYPKVTPASSANIYDSMERINWGPF